jgi:serine phosphatase RsbU (regulator of sigma subunit)
MTSPTRQLERLAEAGRLLSVAETLGEALAVLAQAAADATGATVAVVRVADGAGRLPARGVWSSSASLSAELEGSRLATTELGTDELDESDELPSALRRLVKRSGAVGVAVVPEVMDGQVVASLELMRPREPFSETDRLLARIAAQEAGLLVRAFAQADGPGNGQAPFASLELAGRALTAGTEARSGERIAGIAAELAHAESCLVWRTENGGTEPIAFVGPEQGAEALAVDAERELGDRQVVVKEDGDRRVVLVRVGEPTRGGLRLVVEGEVPAAHELEQLAAFGARAAHALRHGERMSELSDELERSRALLAVVGQAIAELSLSHTLDTAVERVADLLGTERVAVYLSRGGSLETVAERGLAGPHLQIAEALYEAATERLPTRGVLEASASSGEAGLDAVGDAASESGVDATVALPLRAGNEPIGLLVAYPKAGRRLNENESALLAALAGQLAVAVQNARLHEETLRLAREREEALRSQGLAATRLQAFFEISSSFSESMRLDETIAAVTRTAVRLLDLDAAVLRMPEGRGDDLVVRSLQIPDPALEQALAPILDRPQPVDRLTRLGLGRSRRALVLDTETAERLGGGHELLGPFLRRGSSALVVPILASGEVIALLTLLALDPARVIGSEEVETMRSLAAQAAFAIDNARLYQQEAGFANAMQRSLLPAAPPVLAGIEVGSVYESSARLEVGGDLYDYTTLPDGRLAVVVGDVTGKGIDAAADMAMTRFVFRSLAREHPGPSGFLAAVNDVVVDEVHEGKFVTMVYLVLDGQTGELACAAAGHPPPRLVTADGTVRELAAAGLALGVEPGQVYSEARETLEPGSVVVLVTDGVIEARRDEELFGYERLDRLLADNRELAAAALAQTVVDGARSFSGGELADDSAVVVVKRVPS